MSLQGFLDLCDLAKAAAGRGDLPTSRQRFEEALTLRPEANDVRYGLGAVCFAMQDFDAARETFGEVLNLDPAHAGAAVNLGAIANIQGDYDEAVRLLRRGIQLNPKRPEAFYNLGIAYRKLGRNELAIQAYREAHHHNPRMVEAVYNLARLYYEMERWEQAATFFRKAIDINPGFRKAVEGLAMTERKLRPNPLAELFDSDDNMPADPHAGDPRAQRVLEFEKDYEALARAHEGTTAGRESTELCVRASAKLHEALRELAIAVSMHGGGAEVQGAIVRYQGAREVFREAKSRLDVRREALGKIRDELLARG
jgi:tetratricopeptide (TPR) repeat protein